MPPQVELDQSDPSLQLPQHPIPLEQEVTTSTLMRLSKMTVLEAPWPRPTRISWPEVSLRMEAFLTMRQQVCHLVKGRQNQSSTMDLVTLVVQVNEVLRQQV